MDVVEAAFERQHIEAHALVQKPDEARLGQERRAVAMGPLAEGDDAGVTDRPRQRLKVEEKIIRDIKRAEPGCVVFEPGNTALPDGGIELSVSRRESDGSGGRQRPQGGPCE